jgi:hypothetical protein
MDSEKPVFLSKLTNIIPISPEFLRNKTVAYDAEPICSDPDRISGQRISDLSKLELACRPRVSPTSTYQEIFQVLESE